MRIESCSSGLHDDCAVIKHRRRIPEARCNGPHAGEDEVIQRLPSAEKTACGIHEQRQILLFSFQGTLSKRPYHIITVSVFWQDQKDGDRVARGNFMLRLFDDSFSSQGNRQSEKMSIATTFDLAELNSRPGTPRGATNKLFVVDLTGNEFVIQIRGLELEINSLEGTSKEKPGFSCFALSNVRPQGPFDSNGQSCGVFMMKPVRIAHCF
jgi:hypothetical protein